MSKARYGANKVNRRTVSDLEGDIDAREYNILASDVTKVRNGLARRMLVRFATSTGSSLPETLAPTEGSAEWGDGASNYPLVQKTATGTYVITALATASTPGTWVDTVYSDNGVVTNETITVSFRWSNAYVEGPITSAPEAHVRTSRSAHVITVYVYDPKGSTPDWTLDDLGGGVEITVEAG